MRNLHVACGSQPAPRRMVWLPGAYHHATDFVEAGFARAVATRRLCIDLDFVDLDMQHLQDRDAMAQLRQEILIPARATAEVWLCGISLGGLLALGHARRFGTELDGVLLLAPYLGNRSTVGAIERAGGVRAWSPGPPEDDDEEREVWRYVKARVADAPRLYLGYGQEDRFADAHRLLAEVIPSSSVDTMTGGHDWPTWEKLWGNFLNRQYP